MLEDKDILDHWIPLDVAAAMLLLQQSSLRAYLSRHAVEYPARYIRGPRGRRQRVLLAEEVRRLRLARLV